MKTIGLANQGKAYPVMKMVSDAPEMAALLSKMVSSPANTPIYGAKGQREIAQPNTYEFRNTAYKTGRNANDNKAVMQMLPDMELSAQILVSSILSPKDMMTTELIFQAPEGIVTPQVSTELLRSIRQHFDQVYKIKPMLGKILRDILFEKGSYVTAVIPENSLDEIINRHTAITMESVSDLVDREGKIRGLGILGPNTAKTSGDPKPGISMEAFAQYNFHTAGSTDNRVSMIPAGADNLDKTPLVNPYLLVTDNPDVLKFPKIQGRLTEQKISDALRMNSGLKGRVRRNANVALEAIGRRQQQQKLNDREMASVIYKNASNVHTPISVMKTDQQLKRKSVSLPLIMELPSESVIPVHVPGQEEKHIGYFVLLDVNGNPINSNQDKDYYAELSERMNGAGSASSFPSQLLTRIKSMYQGFDCSNNEHLDYSNRVFADMIEQDLLARLRNGIYTNGVALARNEEVYRIMMARTFAQQQTQMLFLPVELVTYFAFRYNADGIGKSLMDDMRVLNSLRAMIMFANTMASVRNSVAQTNVKLKLDEHDPDPYKTIERSMSEIVRAKQQSFPLGANSPVDIVNWLQRAGYQFSFEGHPALPDVNVEFSEGSTNYPKPDTELEENLRKRAIMATGLNPETVDNGFNGEFATSVVASNILLSRRVMQIQEQFTPQLSDHIKKVIQASPKLLDEMRASIENAYDSLKLDPEEVKEIAAGAVNEKEAVIDHLLLIWLEGLETQLPRPNTVTLENQFAAFETYEKVLDKLLDAWISDQMFTEELGGDVAQHVATMRNAVRAHFVRKWVAENGVLPELGDITAVDEEGKALTDFWANNQAHVEALTKTMTKFMVKLQPVKDASNKVLAQATDSAETAGAGAEPAYGSGGGGTGLDDGGFGGGGDDIDLDGLDGDGLGGDAPAGGDELQTTETSEESTTTTTTDGDGTTTETTEKSETSGNPDLGYTYGSDQP